MKSFKLIMEETYTEDEILRMWSSNYDIKLIMKLSKKTIDELQEVLGHKKGWEDSWLKKYKNFKVTK